MQARAAIECRANSSFAALEKSDYLFTCHGVEILRRRESAGEKATSGPWNLLLEWDQSSNGLPSSRNNYGLALFHLLDQFGQVRFCLVDIDHAHAASLAKLVKLSQQHRVRFGYATCVPAERRSSQANTTRAAIDASASLPQARGSYCFLLPTSPSTLSTPS